MKTEDNRFINREISWLHFNGRVLQEADDENVPLISRLRFIGIFSSNLDDFFKIRYASIKQIITSGETDEKAFGNFSPTDTLKEITRIVIEQQEYSLKILEKIYKELERENVFIIDDNHISGEQEVYIKNFFNEKISNSLTTIILDENQTFPVLKELVEYLAIKLTLKNRKEEQNKKFALIEIPEHLNRFVVLPKKEGKDYVILIDDIIRICLYDIFDIFDCASISAHMIKITRDSDIDIEGSDFSKSFVEKISESVRSREVSRAVRFVYDKSMEKDKLDYLLARMRIEKRTDSIIPGGKYHNRRDYINFPDIGHSNLVYKPIKPLPVKGLDEKGSILQKIAKKDYLQFTPYHSFSNTINFLREAAIDPSVRSIKITVYRLAETSNIVNSLINAVKNGKRVTVFIELKARFDEEANIKHAEILEKSGIEIIVGLPKLKVHGKVCVIERKEAHKTKLYGFVSTGNFNEKTARIYTDFTLFTANQEILEDVKKVFDFLDTYYLIPKFNTLIISPYYTDKIFIKLIEQEIQNAKKGLPAYIKLKFNNMTSYRMIKKLYKASNAGVKVQLIIRGVCCLIPGIKDVSENIEAISIVDKFLEHPRMLIFCNNNNPKVFISSADWMTRNLKHRVEVSCPIYDKDISRKIIDMFEIGWKDNVKARSFSENSINRYRQVEGKKVRSQEAIYKYFKNIDK